MRLLGHNILEIFERKLNLLHQTVRILGRTQVASQIVRGAGRLFGQLDGPLLGAHSARLPPVRRRGDLGLFERFKKVFLERMGPGGEGAPLLFYVMAHGEDLSTRWKEE